MSPGARSTDRPEPGAPTGPPRSRDVGIDVARGIAIVAIVLGHVLRGDAAAGLVRGTDPIFDELDTALYLFHLPVFAIAAGFFVGPSLERSGRAAYVRRRLLLFGWLYLLWSLLQGAVKLATATLVNTPTTPGGVVHELVAPQSQLWWFGFLTTVTLAAAATVPWRGGWLLPATAAAAVLVSLLRWGDQGTVLFLQGLGLTGFFWWGTVTGRRGWAAIVRHAVPLAVVGLAVATVLATVTDPMPPTTGAALGGTTAVVTGVLASVAATAGVLAGSALVPAGWVQRVLALLGRRSLEIFLAHIIATAGTRAVLIRLGVTDLAPQLVLGTVAGVTFPLALWWASERVGARWLFALPTARSPRSADPAEVRAPGRGR